MHETANCSYYQANLLKSGATADKFLQHSREGFLLRISVAQFWYFKIYSLQPIKVLAEAAPSQKAGDARSLTCWCIATLELIKISWLKPEFIPRVSPCRSGRKIYDMIMRYISTFFKVVPQKAHNLVGTPSRI